MWCIQSVILGTLGFGCSVGEISAIAHPSAALCHLVLLNVLVSAPFSLENNAYSFGRTTIANLNSGYVWAGVGWIIEALRGLFSKCSLAAEPHLLERCISALVVRLLSLLQHLSLEVG